MANEQSDFNGFKEMMEVSDGNLSTHLRTLERLEYIMVEKSFVGRKPKTNYWATVKGRQAFLEHLNYLEYLIKEHKG